MDAKLEYLQSLFDLRGATLHRQANEITALKAIIETQNGQLFETLQSYRLALETIDQLRGEVERVTERLARVEGREG